MRKILQIFSLFLICANLYAQKEYYNWPFGEYAMINFNNPMFVPTSGYSNVNTLEGCSGISDRDGNMVLSADGERAFYYHNQNYYVLEGNTTSTQSSLIIKQPGQNPYYWIFTTGVENPWYEDEYVYQKSLGYRYTIIDTVLKDVVEQNVMIVDSSTEKICAVHHKNKQDIWIMMRMRASNAYYAYLLTGKGLELKTINEIGPDCGYVNPGYMKFSHDGTKLAHARGYYIDEKTQTEGELTIFDFNDETGELSNPIIIEHRAYGIEFSPDGTKLYFSAPSPDNEIFQIDLSLGNEDMILASRSRVNPREKTVCWALQMGPDGKIYVARMNSNYLGAINRPNKDAAHCEYDSKAVELPKYTKCNYGLPNVLTSSYYMRVLIFAEELCKGEALNLKAYMTYGIEPDRYEWTGPDNFYSDESSPNIQNVQKENEGYYKVAVEFNGVTYVDSLYITVRDLMPQIVPDKKPLLCEGDKIKLTAYPESDRQIYKYYWSTGSRSPYIYVNDSGLVKVIVEDDFGCRESTEIYIGRAPDFLPNISGKLRKCLGEAVVLKAEPEGDAYSYLWSTGETTPEITIVDEGEYSLTVTYQNTCSKSTSKIVSNHVVNLPEIEGSLENCIGDTSYLSVLDKFTDYEWSNGADSNMIMVTEEGSYSILVTDKRGCVTGDTVYVSFHKPPEVVILGNTALCEGYETVLYSKYEAEHYLWSTGDTTRQITVVGPGDYKLILTNEYGCPDSAQVHVNYYPNPDPELGGDVLFCKGESIILSADLDYNNYEWSNGESTKEITVSDPGVYWLKVMTEHGCTGYDTITVEHIEMDFEISPENITFDYLWLGEEGQADILISNNSLYEIEYTLNQHGADFDISGYTGSIDAYGSEILTVHFSPEDIIDYSGNIEIFIDKPCSANSSVDFTGSGKVMLSVDIPGLEANIGDYICIPLYAKLVTDSPASVAIDFSAVVGIDAEALWTDNYGYINDTQRLISLSGDVIVTNQPTNIGEICGKVMIGERDYSPVDLIGFEIEDDHILVDTSGGSLTIGGMCLRNLSRLKTLMPTLMLVMPNPANEEINVFIESEENGMLELKIYNLQGVGSLLYKLGEFREEY